MHRQAVLQDALGPQAVPPVNQRDLAREVGEIQRLFDGGVATADDRDMLVAEEEALAGGACGDAEAPECLFGRDPEPFGLRARRIDQRVADVVIAAVPDQAERTGLGLDRYDLIIDDACAHVLGLLLHLLDEPGTLDHVGEAG